MRKAIESGSRAAPRYSGPPRFPLKPGRYYVAAIYGSARATTEVDIVPGTLVLQTLILHAGVLSTSSRLSSATDTLKNGVAYVVYEAAQDVEGNRKKVTSSPSYSGPPRFVLPARRYHVIAQYGSASANVEVDVAAGEITPLSLDLRAGILLPSAVLMEGATPLEKGVAYVVNEGAADPEGRSKRITSSPSYEEPPRFPLPAGRYVVSATYGSASASLAIDIAAGGVVRQALNLHAGILAVTSAGANGQRLERGVDYVVYEAAKDVEGNRKRVAGSPGYEGPPRFPLPRGRYYVAASGHGGRADTEVDVPEGALTPLELRLSPSPSKP